MNEYLLKDINGAASTIFKILHRQVDHQKQMAFRFMHSNINVSKFGFLIEREFDGELELGIDQLKLLDPQNDQLDMSLSQLSDSQSQSESEDEQVQLNRDLKRGKRQGKGILLGEDRRHAESKQSNQIHQNLSHSQASESETQQ